MNVHTTILKGLMLWTVLSIHTTILNFYYQRYANLSTPDKLFYDVYKCPRTGKYWAMEASDETTALWVSQWSEADRQVLGGKGFWWDHCVVGFTVKWGLVMSSVSSNVLTLSTLLLFLEKAALVSPPTIPKRFGVCYNWTGSGTSMVF